MTPQTERSVTEEADVKPVSSNMHPMLKTLTDLLLLLYYWLEAIVLTFIPRRFMFKDIAGEVVLITGGGSGIGRLTAIKFAGRGAHVVVWDVNEAGCSETAEIIQQQGGQATAYRCDITDREEVYRMAARVKDEVGTVSILVNNAGIVSGKNILDIPDHMVEKTFQVNVISHFWMLKAFLPDMFARDHGHVVGISSIAGVFGANRLADYCATKAAVVRIQESLLLEAHAEGYKNIYTTTVCPYFTNTGLFNGAGTSSFANLNPEYVANEIVAAVLSNQAILYLPRSFYFLHTLKTLLPIRSQIALSDCLGAGKAMEHFKGRNGKATAK